MDSHRASLCVCVDDFGMHEGINTAVLNLIERERVHATSCMVGGPAWRPGAIMLRGLNDERLDTGLHLDMTEFPLRPGSQRPLRQLIALSVSGLLDRGAIRTEIRAQLDAFEDALGRAPAFVDGHQHVHQLPGIRDELLAELSQRPAPHRPWLRSTRQRPSATDLLTRVKSTVIETLGARPFRTAAAMAGFQQNARLLGVYDFKGGPARYRALLANWLNAAGQADLLMCHASAGLNASEPLDIARQAEHAVLMAPGLADMLEERGLVLGPMSDILRHEISPRGR